MENDTAASSESTSAPTAAAYAASPPQSTPAPAPAAASAPAPALGPAPVQPPSTPPRDAAEPAATGDEDNGKLKRALEAERTARKEAEQRAKVVSDEANAESEKVKQQYQQTLDKLAIALDLKTEDAAPDPAEMQRTIAERDNELGDVKSRLESLTVEKDAALRERDVELAAWRAAAKHGANLAVLMDSRAFLSDITRLDYAAESFAADLDAAVTARLKENPALRAAPAVVEATAAGIGASGATRPVTTPGTGTLKSAYSQ